MKKSIIKSSFFDAIAFLFGPSVALLVTYTIGATKLATVVLILSAGASIVLLASLILNKASSED